MPMPAHQPGQPQPRPQRQPSHAPHPSQSFAQEPDPVPRPSPGSGGGSGDGASRRGGGGGRGDYGDLAALMNRLLGSRPQESLSSSGPVSTIVARSIPQYDAEPFLASMFWHRFVQSSFYRELVTRFRASSHANLVVVGHADATRYDLLLLDIDYRGEPQAERLDNADAAIRNTPADSQMIGRVLRRAGSPSNLAPSLISASVNELAANREFGVAIAQAPEQLSTFSVSPALALKNGKQESVATIGVVAIRDSGRVVATTANHAVESQVKRLTVDGASLAILGRHPNSDSCLLAIPGYSIEGLNRFGMAGPLRGVPPRTSSPASFDGAVSGLISTTVTGFDLSVIDPQVDEMSKVYTTPDTAPGDSGAALIDSDDHVIGFAYRRSRYAIPQQLQFSAWVWAEQVCVAHGLFGCLDVAASAGAAR